MQSRDRRGERRASVATPGPIRQRTGGPREPLLIPQWPKDVDQPWYRRRALLQRLGAGLALALVLTLVARSVDWAAFLSLVESSVR